MNNFTDDKSFFANYHAPNPYWRLFYAKVPLNPAAAKPVSEDIANNPKTSEFITGDARSFSPTSSDVYAIDNLPVMRFAKNIKITRGMIKDDSTKKKSPSKASITFEYGVHEAIEMVEGIEKDASSSVTPEVGAHSEPDTQGVMPLFNPNGSNEEKLAIMIGYHNLPEDRKQLLLVELTSSSQRSIFKTWKAPTGSLTDAAAVSQYAEVKGKAIVYAGYVDRPVVSGGADGKIVVTYSVIPSFSAGDTIAQFAKSAIDIKEQSKKPSANVRPKTDTTNSNVDSGLAKTVAQGLFDDFGAAKKSKLEFKSGTPIKTVVEDVLKEFLGAYQRQSDRYYSKMVSGIIFDLSQIPTSSTLSADYSFTPVEKSPYAIVIELSKQAGLSINIDYEAGYYEVISFVPAHKEDKNKTLVVSKSDAAGFTLPFGVRVSGTDPTHALLLRYGIEIVDFSWSPKPAVAVGDNGFQVTMYTDEGWATYDVDKEAVANELNRLLAANPDLSARDLWNTLTEEARSDVDAFIIRFTRLVGKKPPEKRREVPIGGGNVIQLKLTMRHGIPGFPVGTVIAFGLGGKGKHNVESKFSRGIIFPKFVTDLVYRVVEVEDVLSANGNIYQQVLTCEA